MPEAVATEPVVTSVTDGAPSSTSVSLGWRAGLPDDLKQNADVANYKTVGDFTKDALSWKSKVGELEGKLSDSIPKLPDDATDEERNLYLDALGRPKQASEYEFEEEDKNAPEWTNYWKQFAYDNGLTKNQALALSKAGNGIFKKLVDEYNAARQSELAESDQKLRTEMGDKYEANIELAKRLWQKHGEGEFDKAFADGNSANRFSVIRMILKFAALTGEDRSPQSGQTIPSSKLPEGFLSLYEKPPVR